MDCSFPFPEADASGCSPEQGGLHSIRVKLCGLSFIRSSGACAFVNADHRVGPTHGNDGYGISLMEKHHAESRNSGGRADVRCVGLCRAEHREGCCELLLPAMLSSQQIRQ
jgi:hypothetical protein